MCLPQGGFQGKSQHRLHPPECLRHLSRSPNFSVDRCFFHLQVSSACLTTQLQPNCAQKNPDGYQKTPWCWRALATSVISETVQNVFRRWNCTLRPELLLGTLLGHPLVPLQFLLIHLPTPPSHLFIHPIASKTCTHNHRPSYSNVLYLFYPSSIFL